MKGAEDGGVVWNTTANETTFEGSVSAVDLSDVLAQWHYDANLESDSLSASASWTWEGSPMNFDLYSVRGTLVGDLSEGRFLDVGRGGGATGALRGC